MGVSAQVDSHAVDAHDHIPISGLLVLGGASTSNRKKGRFALAVRLSDPGMESVVCWTLSKTVEQTQKECSCKRCHSQIFACDIATHFQIVEPCFC